MGSEKYPEENDFDAYVKNMEEEATHIQTVKRYEITNSMVF